jgi:terminase large subunit-like protein
MLSKSDAGRQGFEVVNWARRLGFRADAAQALVLASDARRGMLNCARQWGKSTLAAAKAVHEADNNPGSLTLVVSPTLRQSGELVRKAAGFLKRLRKPVKKDGENRISLLLDNGSRIVGLPGSEATVRGFSAVSLLVVDEAARVSDELYLAARPMLAVSRGALWLMGTPFGKRGFFHDLWMHAGPEWQRVRVPATECARIPRAFLKEERKSMPDRWFRQEYLCEFVETEGAIFDREVVLQAFSEDVPPLVLS